MTTLSPISEGGGGFMLIRKYLLIALLCLTTLSTVGLGISTGILDHRYKIIRNGYSE